MKKLIFVMIFLTLSSISVSAEPELKGSPQDLRGFLYPQDRIVTISGRAEEKAYSDKAIVALVVTTENRLLSQAISENSELRETIKKALVASGIGQDAIKSARFSSSPEYGWFGNKPSSYKVVNRMAVSIFKETHLKEIAVIADQYEQAELSATSFEHTGKDDFIQKVKAMALDKIIQQKIFYETSLGVKLTPIGIRESRISNQATHGAIALKRAISNATNPGKETYQSTAQYATPDQEPSFDEIKYSAGLSVDFKIVP